MLEMTDVQRKAVAARIREAAQRYDLGLDMPEPTSPAQDEWIDRRNLAQLDVLVDLYEIAELIDGQHVEFPE